MSEETKSPKKSKLKRELIDWGILILIAAVLYGTGLNKPIAAKLQQALLWTGIIQPNTSLNESEFKKADFNVPLLTLDGEEANLKDLEGKVIFMNQWATWCPPCIAEMPNIQGLFESLDNDDVAFVMLSLDEDKKAAQQYISDQGYTFPVYFYNGRRPGVYNSSVVPTTFIISPQGMIVSRRLGMANYNTDTFKEFLANLSDS